MNRKTAFAFLLVALLLVSAVPIQAAEKALQTKDPWMEYALFHMGNVLPFMRKDEPDFLEPGCRVYLGARFSSYDSQLNPLPIASYPVFVDGKVIAIAVVFQVDDELSFQTGPMYAQQLNEFLSKNPNVALVESDGVTQIINDKGEVLVLHQFVDSTIPDLQDSISKLQFRSAIPIQFIPEVSPDGSPNADNSTAVEYAEDIWNLLLGCLYGAVLWAL